MRRLLLAFVAGLLAIGGAGWWWTHRNTDARTDTTHDGPFTTTTTVAVGEVVRDIRATNRLVVFQAYLSAITSATECRFFGCPIESKQTLISPAFVNYFIDMDQITERSVTLADNQLTVRIPPLRIERPNIDTTAVRIFNEGTFSHITSADVRLEEQTRPAAVKQLYAQAQSGFLLRAARKQAVTAVFNNIKRTLIASGHPEVRLSVSF